MENPNIPQIPPSADRNERAALRASLAELIFRATIAELIQATDAHLRARIAREQAEARLVEELTA